MNVADQPTDSRVQARHSNLGLQFESGVVQVVVSSVDGELPLRRYSVPLDPTIEVARALEDAIYATPMLLNDYAGIRATVVTDNFIPVPPGLGDAGADLCGMLDEDSGEILLTDHAADIDIVWTFDRKLFNFIERTFRNCPICCSITPLVRFFSAKALRGNSGKVFVHLHGSSPRCADILVFASNGSPLMITTKRYNTEADALYYILAAIETTGLSRTEDEVQVCGDSAAREALMPLLRQYVRFAVPVIFPSEAFRMGREALVAPFPLIVQKLCE